MKMSLAKTLLLLCVLCLLQEVPASATEIGEIGRPAPSVDNNTDTGTGGGPVVDTGPEIMTYNPTVTALHSLNAFLAGNPEAAPTGIYFLPYLSEFPVNLEDTAAYVVDASGEEHRFAAVYSGYFDSEVAYMRPDSVADKDVGNLITSKKVYSTTDNTRTLQMLGYDLLLSDEKVSIYTSDYKLYASYHPTFVGNSYLTANTIVMDVYKALGEYEWDITFAWTIDNKLSLATSPLQQQISVLTNDEDALKHNGVAKGIDTEEGATWVWATRTNPLLYWDKCKKDVIFSGGAHNATTSAPATVGTDVSVSFSKGQTDTVTFGEFCAITAAMMDLYGEPVMSEAERLIMLQSYALSIPTSASPEITNAVEYLAAKGILDPSQINLDKNVTFADIEPILVRIADKDSRLTFKAATYDISSALFQKGYVKTGIDYQDVGLLGIEEISNPAVNIYNDYFIKSVDGVTNFVLAADCDLGPAGALVADKILCNGVSGDTELLFLNQGITETGYYHFKIAQNVPSAVISYGTDDDQQWLSGLTNYTIPVMGGGVYDIDAYGNWSHRSLDEAGYTNMYLDSARRTSADTWSSDSYLSNDYHWYNIQLEYDSSDELTNIWGNSTLKSASGVTYSLAPVAQLEVGSTTGILIQNESGAEMPSYWWRNEDLESASGKQVACYTVQVENSKDVFLSSISLSSGDATRNIDTCFYNLNGSLLVSFDYLQSRRYASNLNKVPDGYMLTVTKGATSNVTLLPDRRKIIVGNTMYSTGEDVLVYEANGVTYLNYKACIGWTSDLLCINNNGVLSVYEQGTARNYTKQVYIGSTSIKVPYSNSSVQVGSYASRDDIRNNAIRMTATYPLSNYMVVMGDGAVTAGDVLFTVHRKLVCLDGSVLDLGDDTNARELFSQMTGFSLDFLSDDYFVKACPLDRNDSDGNGFDYIEIPTNTANYLSAITVGYVYYPAYYSDVTQALGSCAVGDDVNPIPIIDNGNIFMDMNMNMYSIGDMAPLEEYGTLPYMMYSGDARDKCSIARLYGSGSVTKKADTFEEGALSNVIVYPAPAGVFARLYSSSNVSLGQVFNNNSRVYYGTSKCDVKSTSKGYALTMSGLIVTENAGMSCLRALTGTSGSSVYVLQGESMGINTMLEDDAKTSLDSVYTLYKDVEGLIDWDQYSFKRLIETADTFTSILIIFALAVLPRVGLFLFMILMVLSMIRDVKIWQKFCDSIFDVYKLLTFGRQSVHTINVKRMFIYSIIAQALFAMILDGALFNFIEWVSVFFFDAAQR